MKKLLLITTLVSLAWGQVCSIDGSPMVKLSGESPRPAGNGNYAYLFECDPNPPNPKHQRWIVEQKQNSYQPQQQPQQQSQQQSQQQQQVLPDYSPVIDAMKDKRTPEERKKQEEEYADGWEEGLAWNEMMKEKHPILLKVFQGVVLYGCYLLIQGEID